MYTTKEKRKHKHKHRKSKAMKRKENTKSDKHQQTNISIALEDRTTSPSYTPMHIAILRSSQK